MADPLIQQPLAPATPDYCFAYQYDVWWLCMSKSEWGTWAQVMTGVLGVAVAIWVVRHQLAKSRVADAEREARRLEAYASAFEYAASAAHVLLMTRGAFSPRTSESLDLANRVEEVHASFIDLRIADASSQVEVESLLVGRSILGDLRDLVRRLPLPESDRANLELWSKQLKDRISDLRNHAVLTRSS